MFLAKTRVIVVAGKCVDFYTLRDYEKVNSMRRGSILKKQAVLACIERSKQYICGNRQQLSRAQARRDCAQEVQVRGARMGCLVSCEQLRLETQGEVCRHVAEVFIDASCVKGGRVRRRLYVHASRVETVKRMRPRTDYHSVHCDLAVRVTHTCGSHTGGSGSSCQRTPQSCQTSSSPSLWIHWL